MNDTDIKLPPLSISILAGGRGTRMDGQDKGLACLHGQPLALRSYRNIQSYSRDILVSANRNLAYYRTLLPDCTLVSDHHSNFPGPLAGIYSSLRACAHDYLLTVPCDLLALPDGCVERLWQCLQQSQKQLAYAVINGQPVYPLCLVHKQLLPGLRQQLQQQQFAVWHWLMANHAAAVDFTMSLPHPVNLNTHACLASVERLADRHHVYGALP